MDKYNVSAVIKDPKTLESVKVILAYCKKHDIRVKAFISDLFNNAAKKIRRMPQ